MQTKRSKRSRIRAAKDTAGHGSKKKNRGAGHRGGRGAAGGGKRGDAKIMKITKGMKYLGKHGFKSIKKDVKTITVYTLQNELDSLLESKMIKKEGDTYVIDLEKLGYGKLLSKGKVTRKLNITVPSATENVIVKVEGAGGKVILPQSEEKN